MKIRLTPSPSWELLVPIDDGDDTRISIDEDLPLQCRRLRPEIHVMLINAAKSLPTSHRLHIFEAFRSQERQFAMWNKRLVELARGYSAETVEQLMVRCKNDIADPVGRPSGHQGGTAVDLTIFEDNHPLDMGCEYLNFSRQEVVVTKSTVISATQRQNRQLLIECMEGVGFLNYEQEWWHFSYQDRLWAAMKYHGHDKGEIVGHHLYKYGACYGGSAEVDDRFKDFL